MVLSISKRRIEPDILVLKLSGRLTLGRDSQELEWMVGDLLAKNETKLIFDLADLTFMDSTGLGIVAVCSGKLRESGNPLCVAGANGPVQRLFKITGIEKVLSLYPGVDEAAQSFASASGE